MEKSVLPLNLMAQDKDILKIRFGFLHPPFFSYFHFLIYLVRACMLSHFSCVRFLATLWTIVLQAPLSMEFSRQEYWSGLPCPLPGDLQDPGIEPESLTVPALASRLFTTISTIIHKLYAQDDSSTVAMKPSFFLIVG